jgi:hypothetical protein
MHRNRLPRVMKHYSPNGRRNHARPLKRLLDAWDRNGSTSGPTPWQIYDDNDEMWMWKCLQNGLHELVLNKVKKWMFFIRDFVWMMSLTELLICVKFWDETTRNGKETCDSFWSAIRRWGIELINGVWMVQIFLKIAESRGYTTIVSAARWRRWPTKNQIIAISDLMPSVGRWRKIRTHVLQFWLKILGLRHVSTKFIPHVLAAEREREREREPTAHLHRPFAKSWTRRSKRGSDLHIVSQNHLHSWKTARGRVDRMWRPFFIVSFDCLGLVIMSSHLRNQDFYLTVLWSLCEKQSGIYYRKFGECEAGGFAIPCCPS